MDKLTDLRAREEEVEREWQWLHDALNTIARARADQGDAAAFRLMQAQAMVVGQRRVELRMQAAELEGPRSACSAGDAAQRSWLRFPAPR